MKHYAIVLLGLTAVLMNGCERDISVSGNISSTGQKNPHEVTAAFVERGMQSFEKNCALCHGSPGTGGGIAAKALKQMPPSYHTEKLRTASDRYLFDVITNGPGMMPAFGNSLSDEEKWSIVAYIRELQARTA